MLVAPHAGAWIETLLISLAKGIVDAQSPPTRGRGLKPCLQGKAKENWKVAPHAGAWIETALATPTRILAVGRPPRGGVD